MCIFYQVTRVRMFSRVYQPKVRSGYTVGDRTRKLEDLGEVLSKAVANI